MATNEDQFSLDDEYDDFTPIPEDKHPCAISQAYLLQKSGKTFMTLVLRWTIALGENTDRYWFDYIPMIRKPYGFGKLQEICRACGIEAIATNPDGLDPYSQTSVHNNLLGALCIVETANKEVPDREDPEKKRTYTNSLHYLAPTKKQLKEFKSELGPDGFILPDDAHNNQHGVDLSKGGIDDPVAGNDGFSDDGIPF